MSIGVSAYSSTQITYTGLRRAVNRAPPKRVYGFQPPKLVQKGSRQLCPSCGTVDRGTAVRLPLRTKRVILGYLDPHDIRNSGGSPMKQKLFGVALALVVSLLLLGCGQETSTVSGDESATEQGAVKTQEAPAPVTPDMSDTWEFKLASIEAGSEVDNDDPTIKEFADLLDSMEQKTTNTRQELSDAIVRARELLQEEGISMGLLELARELDTSMPDD